MPKLTRDEIHHILCKWITEAEDTSQVAERALLTDAVMKLRQKKPDIDGAIQRIVCVADDKSGLVQMPKWFMEASANMEK